MVQNILRNTGKLFIIIPIIFLCNVLSAADVVTELAPERISVGESAQLKIKISGSTSKITPVKFPALDGIKITYSGLSRSFQFINGKTWSGMILNFSIVAEKKGVYRIPPFILDADGQTVSSREVVLTVSESFPRGKGYTTAGTFNTEVITRPESVFAGEPVIMHYIIHTGSYEPPRVRGFIEQPKTKGFVVKGLEGLQDEGEKIYAGSFCLIPVDNGEHVVGGGSVEAAVEVERGFFSMDERIKISFPYKKIRVLPIPAKGKPDSFSGDVGEFKLDAEIPAGQFRAFEEIKIPVKVSGRGNLVTLSKPRIDNEDGIKLIIEEKNGSLSVNGDTLSGEKNFIITIIPQREGVINPGKIFISCFNPYKKVYETAASSPLSFEIRGGMAAGNKGEVQFNSDDSMQNKFKPVYAAILFVLIILSVAGLVIWEQKKLKMVKTELGIEQSVPEKADNSKKDNDILKKIRESISSGNREEFLYQADKCINRIDDRKLSENEKARYNSFKDKIYFSRYAGGEFADADMNEVYEWLNRYIG
jgi:hypothetical protein